MINIAICDDSPDYMNILEDNIKTVLAADSEYAVYKFQSIEALRQGIKNVFFDILFLDIMIGDSNSVRWLIDNPLDKKTQVILMTGYPEEAYDLSETSCCYYIIKSKTSTEQIKRAVSKALRLNSGDSENYTLISIGNKNYTIDVQQIIFIESYRNNLVLYFIDGQKIVIYNTIKEFSKKLPACFLKCHRCYLVNMNHIIGFEPYRFIVATEKSIPIPQKKYGKIISSYRDYLELTK